MNKIKSTNCKNVLVVEDHPIFRDGLVRIASSIPGVVVCGEADNAIQAFDAIEKLKPDLVLMDINIPGKSGVELLQDVHAMNPEQAVLVVSMYDERMYAERVLRAGGCGYIMKQAGPNKMREAIIKTLNGQVFVSESTATAVLDAFCRPRSKASTSDLSKLTDRELEILRLIGNAKDTHEIADILHISTKTVDTHRAHLREKLRLKNGIELVHYAMRCYGDII